ncbi:MAG: elongation factor G [SAR324 cluster bacterium]|nr:elongation factor G [SAR324 cluster bacterium]
MANYAIGLIAHGGAGKSSLAESMLYRAGAIEKPGSVDAGTSVMDWETDEKERKSSVSADLGFFEWNGSQVDIVDTPGSMNFIGATVAALRVVDGVIMVASAEPGLQSQTEVLWDYLEADSLPRLMVINKMDREQANFRSRLDNLNELFGSRLVPITIPMGQAESFKGVVDVMEMCAYDYSDPDKPQRIDIPADLQEEAEEFRAKLMEGAAEGDDELLEKYLETESLNADEIRRGLREATHAGKMVPVLCASATGNIGTNKILDALVNLLPDTLTRTEARRETDSAPEGYVPDSRENSEFSAQVFKTKIDHYAGKLSIVRVRSGEVKAGEEVFNTTTDNSERSAHLFKLMGKEQKEVKVLATGELGALPKLSHTSTGDTLSSAKNKVEFAPIQFPDPVLTQALKLSGKGEEEKLATALHRMMDEDATLKFRHSTETTDMLVSGMGQIHLDMVLGRLKREFNITASYDVPQVPYRETIRSGSKAQGKYKKQSGGRGQYGDCWLALKPLRGEDSLVFNNAIVGGAIPRQYIPAVEKGIVEAMHKGIVAGYPVIGIDVTVYDGSFHDVDSSEMAFKVAGSMAFKKAMEEARPVLLEPIMELEITVNPDYTGDVMGDINSRRGKVLGMDSRGRNQVVRAEVPMGESLSYAIDLRAMTSGQGIFSQKFVRYDEVPAQISDKIVQTRQKAASE